MENLKDFVNEYLVVVKRIQMMLLAILINLSIKMVFTTQARKA